MEVFNFYPWLFTLLATVFGLVVGSFLNVVIYRLPVIMECEWRRECAVFFQEYKKIAPPSSRYSLSVPRSVCLSCGYQLRLIDIIPLVSWFLLKGKCHKCQENISFRYPLVESLAASTSFIVADHFGFSYFAVALLFFTFALIVIAFIDLDTMLLPDQLTLPLIWSGILLSLLKINPVSLEDSVVGAVSGYLFFWTIYWLFKLCTGKEGMGYSDFKLLAAIGAWLGWQYLGMVVLFSSLFGLCFGLLQLRLENKEIGQAFAFAPHLAMAGWISSVFGEKIMVWYWESVVVWYI
ncbi:type 4 prepilin-like proteins leader peptide-processing enzyme [Candidatus Photodesmus blepharus]|uniref:Prepilin leader peptidase/N-methyltransferase n=1 Tax=Candidatus Photodesmus blepharonis TaxID=1179155 RepID=A0A084CP51_9GAMM|nr:A24 family peptidase [Candidatus Photodesmus blepharus]KEY91580.1 type 4 prepilin-like proteins leader peptide-processing enzyme [Candidatus Photodesmus blepharus]